MTNGTVDASINGATIISGVVQIVVLTPFLLMLSFTLAGNTNGGPRGRALLVHTGRIGVP